MLLLWGQGGGRNVLNRVLSDGSTVANYQAGIGITGTTNASAWANNIGAAGSLLQANGANQPTINVDGSLTFDGIAHFMQATFTLAQPETIYLVGRQITFTNNDYIFDGKTANRMVLYQDITTPKVTIFSVSSGPNSSEWLLNTYGVVIAVYNDASSSLRVNGNAANTGAPGNAGAAAGFTLGAKADGTNFSNIQVSEVIIRNVADSTATQTQIQTLLKSIYGTP